MFSLERLESILELSTSICELSDSFTELYCILGEKTGNEIVVVTVHPRPRGMTQRSPWTRWKRT